MSEKDKEVKVNTVKGFKNEISTTNHEPFTVKELANLLTQLVDAGWGDYKCSYDDGACIIVSVEVGPDGVFFVNY